MTDEKAVENMTYEEYVAAIHSACKEDATVKAHPEEFEKVFRELEEEGDFREDYEKGLSPYSNIMAICLMV